MSDKLKGIEESVKNSEKKMKSTKDVANDYDTINKQMEEHQVRRTCLSGTTGLLVLDGSNLILWEKLAFANDLI